MANASPLARKPSAARAADTDGGVRAGAARRAGGRRLPEHLRSAQWWLAPFLSLTVAACSMWPLGKDEQPASSAPALAGPAAPSEKPPANAVNSVVAVVDGEPITVGDLRAYRRTGGPFLPEELRHDNRALLQSMIERRLLKAEFEKNGVRVDDATVERYIEGILRESGQSRAEIEVALSRVGLSWKDYFERMREEVQRVALVNLLIRSRVNVPDEEVEEAWENDPAFKQNEKLVVADIFLPLPADEAAAAAVRAQAAEVARQARSDFEEAARKHSKGPGAAEGGTLGEFERGTMADYFEKALTGLDEGDVSAPIEGGGGIHIVKLIDVKKSGRRPLAEVKEEIREKLYERRLQERYEKWASEDLRREHRVEILMTDLSGIAG
ncbi:MAG TPA: peptidylprolyl isomerase [Candidatus Limnocylindrales bacterium]|nr:peptidylprolyl isomerase [Candidatus Limnocylindrales bacterium]